MDSVIDFKREVYGLALNELLRFLPALKNPVVRVDKFRQAAGNLQSLGR
jgi:hypothetical protein